MSHWTGTLDHAQLDRVAGEDGFDEATISDDHGSASGPSADSEPVAAH